MSKLLDLIHAKQKKLQESKNRLNTLKVKQGSNRYRLLPSWRGDGEEFWHDYAAHWVKDATGAMKGVFTCQYVTYGQACPVCEAMKKLKNGVDEITAKIIDQARASKRVLVNVLEINGDKPSEPQILEMPMTVFEDLLAQFELWGDKLIRLEQGHDFMITRTGSGMNTSYSIVVCPEPTNVNPAILKNLPDIDKAIQTNTDPTNALSGLSEIAGVLPAVAKPALTAVPKEQPAMIVAPADDSQFETVQPAPAKAPVEAPAPVSAPVTVGEIKIEEAVENMNNEQLQAFINDL